eukprot:CAMPEP_0185334500 /NCGR_PEP_ID=MMETSP1363-20130426/85494_1 /TAXON_ID=38817 /ORGANISM="Gephyrocapsa oceanica, Strain RCC1303" /LENGTH=60 /DNA_ID=CAMNT_0027933491 /DNA_START=408 /DNA_END=587 /DNA_ORIENTATION=-
MEHESHCTSRLHRQADGLRAQHWQPQSVLVARSNRRAVRSCEAAEPRRQLRRRLRRQRPA